MRNDHPARRPHRRGGLGLVGLGVLVLAMDWGLATLLAASG
jgi:hypothetical protein